MTQFSRLGILGGTFDPVHVGHLHIASCALKALQLDQVLLMPAGSPPHKPHEPVTPARSRLEMVELAIDGYMGLSASRLDIQASQPSYTSELLKEARHAYPGAELWFIIGSDSLADFPKWHDPPAILRQARLAVAERPGWSIDEVLNSTPIDSLGDAVDRFESVPIDLSATRIRAQLRAGQPVDWLVAPEVRRFIDQTGIYRDTNPG